MKIKEDLGAPTNRGWVELISASPLSSDDDEDKDDDDDVDDSRNRIDSFLQKPHGTQKIGSCKQTRKENNDS